ncbi:MAG: glycosyltransferase [Parcubacteria group bacterium]
MPKNLFFIDHYKPGEYDMAILHLDQQCLYGDKKGIPYKYLNEQIQDIPKLVLNHGTPFFCGKDSDELKDEMKKMIGDNPMLVNSDQAWREWGFGRHIIHGISPAEFKPAAKKENRIIITLSPNYNLEKDGWAEYYNRYFLKDVKEKIDITHIGQDIIFENFDDYRKYLSESLIYFNPTIHSPMPRGRTEAMLSGCCVVSTPYHDWDKYIIDGKNGFLISGHDIEEAVKILDWCRRNPAKTKKIGEEGRKTAMHHFSPERYRKDWLKLIGDVLNGHVVSSEVKNLSKQIEDLVYTIPGAEVNDHWRNILKSTLETFSKKITKL